MTPLDDSAAAPSEPTSTPADRFAAGAFIDVLRAGLQVAGLGFVWVAVSERFLAGSERSRGGDLAPFLALTLVSTALATWFGFPERPNGLRGFLRRFAAVLPCGVATAVGAAIGFANALSPGESHARAAACVAIGLSITALGVWPRRSVAGARSGALADAWIGGWPLVLPALAGAAYVERWRGWALGSFAAASPRAGSSGVALAVVLGLATLVSLVLAAWLARRAHGGRWIAFIAPAVALLGVFAWMRWVLAAEDGPVHQGATYASVVDGRTAALAKVSLGACAGALVSAILLAVGAIALGARAFRRGPQGAGERRGVAVFSALTATLGVYAILMLVRIGDLSTDARLVTFVAAVPAALATVGVWLAAAGADDPESERAAEAGGDLLVAAGCALGALALAALGRTLVADLPGKDAPFQWHEVGPVLHLVHRQTLLATSLHALPVVIAALVAFPPRRWRAAFVRASIALAVVALLAGLPSWLLRSQVSSAAGELHAPWRRRLPPGVSLPELSPPGGDCDIVLDDLLFVGSERLTRDGRDLGASTDLDSDQGCNAVATALDRAREGRKDRPRLAVDAQVPWARLECLARALASEKAARPPQCRIDWIATHGGSGAPACIPVRVGGGDCNAGGRAQGQSPRSWLPLMLLTTRGTLESEVEADMPSAKVTIQDMVLSQTSERWPGAYSRSPAFAATPDVPAGSLLARLAGPGSRGSSGGVPLLLAEVGPPPKDIGDGDPPAGVAIRLRTRGPGAAAIAEKLQTRLLSCHVHGNVLAAGTSRSGAVFALIDRGGMLIRFFSAEGSDAAPDATRCMRDVLAGASWPTGQEALISIRYDLSPAPAAASEPAAPKP